MVHNCAINSCPLHNRRNIRKGLLFHSFPVDEHRFELWRQTVFNHCAQTLSITKHSKICYRHFEPDDYIANHTGLTRYLKATAIPSIFTETNSNTNIFNNHILTSSTELHTNRTILPQTTSSLVLLPSKSSSIVAIPTNHTNTKAKRLLNTIDKLHQIQNASKIIGTPKITYENEQIIELPASKITNDNSLSRGDDSSLQIPQVLTIDHHPSIQDTFQHSSLESDTIQCAEDTTISLPKNHLEDALFQFLEQANLLQYYSAFIEQGGDDLKQLADAQDDDFQEIITLVGMASKPLHIKRFKKALADYRQSRNHIETNHSFINHSYSTISLRRLSTGESLSDRPLFSSLLHPASTNNSPKVIINHVSSNGCLNKLDSCNNNNTHQLLDDNQRKMIADEAERLANLLPITIIKKLNGRTNISKDLFATINLPRDFEDRWQRIRKYSAIYNRFNSKKPNQVMSLHEILINEAAAAICFHRPEFLTRRDELLHLARRILQNIGISTGTNIQKRPLSMLTCDIIPAKQVKLNMSLAKPTVRQRDPDTFRLMWHNRETKVEQIPIEIKALQCEQNKLLQQLKQNIIDSSPSVDNSTLKKQIDDIGKKIEQLGDEEKNLRRLIRKKKHAVSYKFSTSFSIAASFTTSSLRAKERQQQKQQMTTNYSTTIQDLMVPILPMTPLPLSLPNEIEEASSSSLIQLSDNNNSNNDMYYSTNIKKEKLESLVNLSSPVLKTRKELLTTPTAKPIDKRRQEVNERSILFHKKTNTLTDRSTRLTPRNRSSSSTTAVELVHDSDRHSQTLTDVLATVQNAEGDIVDSKSFIHNLDFSVNSQIENP